jgi:uncharacterized membrane protein YqjE
MPRASNGLVDNVRNLAADAVRALRTRLELAGLEIQEEKAHLVRSLVIAASVVYLLSFGSLLAVLWIVTSVPDAYRGTVLGALALVFLAAGGGTLLWLVYGRAQRKPLFAALVAVLDGDERALDGARS